MKNRKRTAFVNVNDSVETFEQLKIEKSKRLKRREYKKKSKKQWK